MSEAKLHTNLASEFYVLSILHRLGVDATPTWKNKKAVDIIVVKKRGKTLTIDVKGLQGTACFPADNCTTRSDTHFYVFVAFVNKIQNVKFSPEVYIVSSMDLGKKHKELNNKTIVHCTPKKRKTIYYSSLKKLSKKYLHKWDIFKSNKQATV